MGQPENMPAKKDPMRVDEKQLQRMQDEKEKNYWKDLAKRLRIDWRLVVMIIPALLVFFLWRYLPLYGLIGAFKDNDPTIPIMDRGFAGLNFFQDLIVGQYAKGFWQALRNTFFLSFYSLLFGFPMPIVLAIFFNEIKSNFVRSAAQVATYLPRFVSTVVITSLILLLLKPGLDGASPGVIANVLTSLRIVPIERAVNGVTQYSQYFRSVYVISDIWETAGYQSIVFFAAIISISPTNYEAAAIDGAGKMGQMRYVVLPGISSTIIIMLIIRIGQLMNIGYEKTLLLYNSNIYRTADILGTYVLRLAGLYQGATQANQALGSAADLMSSALSMVLVIGANKISRRVSETSLY